MEGLPLRSSLDAGIGGGKRNSIGLPRGSMDMSRPQKQSAPPAASSGAAMAVRESDMRGMQEVLPQADPKVLELYLRRFGNQIDGIG